MGTMGPKTRRAFTMIELLGVMTIIGILMIFILVAASGGVRDAQREATRALINKIDGAMNSFLEAVSSQRNTANAVQIYWASVVTGNGQIIGSLDDRGVLQRAQVIANYDRMRAEVPDTFWIQDKTAQANPYPINFAQQAFQTGHGAPLDYVLPLGANAPLNIGAGPTTPGMGIYGASYAAAAGLYKNLGQVPNSLLPGAQAIFPQGYDGVDNDGDQLGLIDNVGEGIINPGTNTQNANVLASLQMSLSQHKHITARSEMLYALLVEGSGQYGSFLEKDQFTSDQVKDTDGDGLPEFVDAWGNPLQFFRWPVFYSSDVQKGVPGESSGAATAPYPNVFAPREQDPYDPNQQLMQVSWWGSANAGPSALGNPAGLGFAQAHTFLSGPAFMFQSYYKQLVEPMSFGGVVAPTVFWDRSAQFAQRRAYYTRFLILSSGPDGLPGVPILSEAALQSLQQGAPIDTVSAALQLEGQAAQWDLSGRLSNMANAQLYGVPLNPISNDTDDTSGLSFFNMGLDDITNHNLNSTAQAKAQ